VCEEQFHPAPDPVEGAVGWAIDPQQIQNREQFGLVCLDDSGRLAAISNNFRGISGLTGQRISP
jgi:hypothetical protein